MLCQPTQDGYDLHATDDVAVSCGPQRVYVSILDHCNITFIAMYVTA
jgi:hypothetical protein